MRILAAALLFALAAAAAAQGPGAGEPRTPPTPPASEPGAPGDAESAKAPPAPGSAAAADNRTREAVRRCGELDPPMREQCLAEQRGAAAGDSASPLPRTAPPPQNPR